MASEDSGMEKKEWEERGGEGISYYVLWGRMEERIWGSWQKETGSLWWQTGKEDADKA